jgi:hypothetical protein
VSPLRAHVDTYCMSYVYVNVLVDAECSVVEPEPDPPGSEIIQYVWAEPDPKIISGPAQDQNF